MMVFQIKNRNSWILVLFNPDYTNNPFKDIRHAIIVTLHGYELVVIVL